MNTLFCSSPPPGLFRWTIRLKLTLWYAAVLLCILGFLSFGIYAFVRSRLERALDAQLDRDFGTVATVVAAAPVGKGSGGHIPGDVLFMVMDGSRVLYHSDAWCRAKFLTSIYEEPPGTIGVWRSIERVPHRLKVRTLTVQGRELKATVAEDTSVISATLSSLSNVFLLSIPGAIVLSVLGGYFVAGRSLAPVSTMAAKSREITVEALSNRLPVENPDDELGQMATVFNETLGRLEESFERLRNFTGNVSHELRTPLTAMRSVGEVALQQNLDRDGLRDVIGSMLEEVQRLTKLVDLMLGLARGQSVDMAQRQEEIDVAADAAAALELVRVLAEEKHQNVSGDLHPAPIRANAALLRQALLNLLDNAIRYTPTGGLISVRVKQEPGGEITIEVQDNGPGIPANERSRIFDRFYRCQNDVSESSRGTGLGLAIARSAVEALGGCLKYSDAAGGGSLFCIHLPAYRASKAN